MMGKMNLEKYTKWTFGGLGWKNKKNVFEVPNIFRPIEDGYTVIDRLAFSFRAEVFSDVMKFFGNSVKPENLATLVIAFAHAEMAEIGLDAEVNILVQSTTQKELTEEVALAELRRIMELEDDSHVMCGSLQPADKYTGERFEEDAATESR
jgi:hypothetical protein